MPPYHRDSMISLFRNVFNDYWSPVSDSLQHQAITIVKVIRQEYLDLRRVLIEWFTTQQKKHTRHAMITLQLYYFGQCERWFEEESSKFS